MTKHIDYASQEAWIKAWRFAAVAHAQQKFPGTEMPYLVHLGMVGMELLAAHAQEPIDGIGVAMTCAILHDAMEDQEVAHATLVAEFGPAVADGVAALSKAPGLSKADAMADSLARIVQQPKGIWCVKLADRICNLEAPPHYWPPEKVSAYGKEACLILDTLGAAHGYLAQRLAAKIAAYPG
ncbi:bifunctional (p)ppGpp synthetase/guanosine-3',5'-bis(diphosphate) 3'-pyrophosphohydrolase [Massilia violaceinigra]|uniref:Bifunctional (P)ppGpp synthetase/guanosine-3',5'-bis(Diphosphate) 3'-pyrophosphohydrolase n=1 Tax=Massilia violaceinigra TaxID=2045208 RepID=A0ABY4A5E2_9BURK|nr:HD domain-containing protein [Massilia violaceinigra]UOD29972.1 bifunctional (p)ppGpp synthetase/guanosine-3',5'-bis(diphosphate) 3'-pyrophosphohydrolase [Massilia violaceinigra]